MLRPSKRHIDAIRGLHNASPTFFVDYYNYLKESREQERSAMEICASENNEIQKGKCQMLTEQINNLKSLIPKIDIEDQF